VGILIHVLYEHVFTLTWGCRYGSRMAAPIHISSRAWLCSSQINQYMCWDDLF
jgi:hypothetical protein